MTDIGHMRELIDTGTFVMVMIYAAAGAYAVLALLLGIAMRKRSRR